MKKKANHNPIASLGAASVLLIVALAAKHVMKKYGQKRI